ARAVDPGGQRGQGFDRAVLRAEQPLLPDRRAGRRQSQVKHSSQGPMRLEYFQLIDRIIDLNLTDLTIRVEANVPTESTIFEGHFPGRPLMPGVLLIEAMAQASGWLIIGRTKFAKMPFLAALKEVKLRTFVTPGQALMVNAKIMHEGSGFALTEAEIRVDGKMVCNAD